MVRTTITTEERLEKIAELHCSSGNPVEHWCSNYGGSMEPSHEQFPANSCEECGTETEWPCDTYRLAVPDGGSK